MVGLGTWSAHTMGARELARAGSELEALADLGDALFARFVARGRDKLTTLARLLGATPKR